MNSFISSFNMKRFIYYFITLFIIVIGLALINDILCVWLIRHAGSSSACKMERLWENPEHDEIPIFGSSRALGNFVPSIISPKCFNYGCNGMGKEEITFLMNVAAKRNSGKSVIVNFDPWQSESGSPFVGDYRLAPESKQLSLKECIPGIRFHGALRSSITEFLNSRKAVTKVIDHGAELLKNSRNADEWKIINTRQIAQRYFLNPTVDEPFESVIHAFSPRKVYIVICPCSSHWTDLYTGLNKLNQYLEHLKNVCPNTIVINLFEDSSFSDDDFADATHLNINGARKLSQKVAEVLAFEKTQ